MSGSTELAVIPAPSPKILCARQGEIQIEFDDSGNASLIQKLWPDPDSVIHISRDNLQTFWMGFVTRSGLEPLGPRDEPRHCETLL